MIIKQIRLWNKRGTQVVDKLFSVFIRLSDRRRWYSKMSFHCWPTGKIEILWTERTWAGIGMFINWLCKMIWVALNVLEMKFDKFPCLLRTQCCIFIWVCMCDWDGVAKMYHVRLAKAGRWNKDVGDVEKAGRDMCKRLTSWRKHRVCIRYYHSEWPWLVFFISENQLFLRQSLRAPQSTVGIYHYSSYSRPVYLLLCSN